MKQYLHSKGPTIVAAFNNVAYAVLSILLDQSLEGNGLFEKVTIIELLSHVRPSKDEKNVGLKVEIDNADKGLSPYMLEQKQSNAIQAVSSHWDTEKEIFYYAVSRYDKSLAVYSISKESIKQSETSPSTLEERILRIEPAIVHKTNKRSCSLTFAHIPSAKYNNQPTTVILAGDLNGDATAYVLDKETDKSSCRVLLSHTASMLTKIEIVDDGRQCTKILTADRDEKVRVSSFPDCYHVEGYLLGHTSYVSDIKIAKNCHTGPKCVTCSGDGTLRLFDYEKMNELSKLKVPADYQSKSTDGNDANCASSPVPIRLAINNSGTTVAVLYDSFNSVQLFSITSDDTTAFKLVQNFDCRSSPLGINFNEDGSLSILTREPNLIRLSVGKNGLFDIVEDQLSVAFEFIIKGVEVTMPMTLLETDKTTGKVKLSKKVNKGNEKFADNQPWLKRERVETYKKGVQRRKQRKLEKEKEAQRLI